MALKLYYKENDSYVEVSSGGEFTNPLTSVHNGKSGDLVTEQLFIKNDDSNVWYDNVTIIAYDSTSTVTKDDTDHESTGWGIKLSDGVNEPTVNAWKNILWSNTISMVDVGGVGAGDATTYFSFWRLITCPPHSDIQVKKNLSLRVEYTERAV